MPERAPGPAGAATGPRIAPGGRRDVGTAGWAFAHAAGLVAGTGPPNVFLTLGRHRRLFRGWLRFAGRLMPGGLLPRRETELVILRVAHLAGSSYEVAHHERLGRRAGLDPDDLRRVAVGPGVPGWSSRERTLLATVDALHERRDLDDAEWALLRVHLGEREAIELCLLVGHYEMLATVLTTLRVQPDVPRRRRRRG
ncbi:carboxymuconolactone decarboxylase family protein [Patulibacter minatonensis]|uniref:carboxymuconolactone decarboxylase family protein n=1 Tax=Patulibacter minatonensis TaxID=298163 RepID=UPI0004BC28FF|nr:carboxymuconolactone decarboxylase family protein [Patulibacter minatonensis]